MYLLILDKNHITLRLNWKENNRHIRLPRIQVDKTIRIFEEQRYTKMKILLHDLDQEHVCHEEELQGEIDICRISSERPRAASFLFNCKVMSRRHAVILHRDNKFFVKDLRSSNGTFVNGSKLEAKQEKEIFNHDVLQFGVCVGNNYPLRVSVEFLQDCHSR